MKRFIVFIMADHEARGGMEDFSKDFDTFEDAEN